MFMEQTRFKRANLIYIATSNDFSNIFFLMYNTEHLF